MSIPLMHRLAWFVAALVVLPSTGAAQSATPWDAFIGCWVSTEALDSRVQTCFVPLPGDPNAVERVVVRADSIVGRERLSLSGAPEPVQASGCRGAETATSAADGSRVYMRGEVSCGSVTQVTASLMALSTRGELIRVYSVTAGGQQSLITAREASVPAHLLPAAVSATLADHAVRARGARVAASRPLDVSHIEEALRQTDPVVIEAWMVEATREASGFRAPRATLERLAAAGAPAGVIDMAVMIGNPKHFDVHAVPDAPERRVAFGGGEPPRSSWGLGCDVNRSLFMAPEFAYWMAWAYVPALDPWGFGNGCSPFAFWNRSGFSPFAWGVWYPGAFQGPGYVGRRYRDPVIVRAGGSISETIPLGRVEKGRGYAPRDGSAGGSGGSGARGTATPREPARTTVATPTRARSGEGAPRGEGGNASGGASRPRTETSSGTGRTAQPRSPDEKKP